MKWEFVKTIHHGVLMHREHIKRLKVPGGWLVKYMDVSGPRSPVSHATVYVPDCGEAWDVTKEPIKLEQFVNWKTPNFSERTCRFKVPGGWVVLDGQYVIGQSHISLIFVSDPNYQWEITEPDDK